MEYIGLLASYFGTSVVTTRLILKNEEVINLGRTFAQAGIIAAGIVIFTILLNMLRAYRVCDDKSGKKSYGFASGISLSIFACIAAIGLFILLNMTGILANIITAILPVMADYVEFIRGFGVALAGFIGYWFGRIFISLC